MQIQRTGYQQNFGTNLATKIHSPKMLEKLAILDKRLAGGVNPECRCIKFSPNEVLFADGDDATLIQNWRYGEGLIKMSKKEELEELAEGIAEDVNTHEAEVEGDTLDELLKKVPMLGRYEKVKAALVRLFNSNEG